MHTGLEHLEGEKIITILIFGCIMPLRQHSVYSFQNALYLQEKYL